MEISATLRAAWRHLGKRLSDPLVALGGWVGALAVREATPRTTVAHASGELRQRQKLLPHGQKRKHEDKCSICNALQSARTPKRCLYTALGVLSKLHQSCVV
jgi:hypothetical protein